MKKHPDKSPSPKKLDPYEVLGVAPGSTPEEIKRAYRSALAKYHPDKVSHLGDELKHLAEEKTREITAAYKAII